MLGTKLGGYEIVGQIGEGGMATVYKAYQPAMDRYVALKILPPAYAKKPDFVQRFIREARTIARLEHRNILPVHDFGEENGITYLAMRYVEAGTLKDILAEGTLTLRDVVDVVRQTCAGLDYAHRQGVIHRDVKPANIIVDDEGAAYLTDFGIAKVLEGTVDLTESGAAVGTPAYMAPEQSLGEEVDARTDIYALGIMLYEMVVGEAPYSADTPVAVALAHIHRPLPRPRDVNPGVPEVVEQVILKALAKEKAERYESARDLSDALQTALEASGVSQETSLLKLASKAQSTRSAQTRVETAQAAGDFTEGITTPALAGPATPQHKRAVPLGTLMGGVALVGVLALAAAVFIPRLLPGADTGGDAQVTPSTEVAEVDTGRWPVVMLDEFDGEETLWFEGELSNDMITAVHTVENGKYVWETNGNGTVNWYYAREDAPVVSDFYFSVEAQKVSGPSTASYGYLFRTNDAAAYYFHIVDSTQQYLVSRWDFSSWTPLIPPTFSEAIRPDEVNTLAVQAEGSHFVFLVNGEIIAQLDDDTNGFGVVGLAIDLVSPGDEAIFEWDNFELRAPDVIEGQPG